jgi:hypothetical protein
MILSPETNRLTQVWTRHPKAPEIPKLEGPFLVARVCVCVCVCVCVYMVTVPSLASRHLAFNHDYQFRRNPIRWQRARPRPARIEAQVTPSVKFM